MSFLSGLLKRTAPTHFAQPYKLKHDRQQHLLEARKGRGKTATMVKWAYECAKDKVRIGANFHLNKVQFALRLVLDRVWPTFEQAMDWCQKNIVYLNTWDQIMLFVDGLLLLDEVNRLFDSQDRSKEDRVPRVVLEWLQLLRRNMVTLVCAAQSMDWLTNRIRQLFDILWRAKKEVDKRGRIKNFWLYGSDPWSKGLSSDVQRSADFKVRIPFDPGILRMYDTLERIQAIPNVSRFERFYEVYQEQLRLGILQPPTIDKRRCACCKGLIDSGRAASAATNAPREERSAARGLVSPGLPHAV